MNDANNRQQRIEPIIRQLLEAIGEDPSREGLKDTPRRVAKLWCEFIDYNPGETGTAFESITTDQMVVVSGLKVWSMCEHHLAPFWCRVSIGYICRDKVLGLSKLARIAHKHAHRLQLQERLVHGVAQEVMEKCGSDDVAVIATGEHLCMSMRGIRTDGLMTSSSMNGVFKTNPQARDEFLKIVGMARREG